MTSDRASSASLYNKRLFFTIVFFSAILLSFMAGYFMPAAVDDILRSATSSGAVFLAKLLGLDAFTESGHIISIEGQRLSIVSECSAIGYIFIFASAVMAFPSRGRKKLSGLLVGIPLIIFLNLFRIVTLGWMGGHFPAYFDIFHTILWEGGFVVIIFLVWIAWLNDLFLLDSSRLTAVWEHCLRRDFYLRLLSLIVVISILIAFADVYQRLIALGAERLIYLIAYDGVVVRADGNVFVIAFSRSHFKEFWAGLPYLIPFVVLMFLFPRIGKAGDERAVMPGEAFLKFTSGIVVMTLIQLFTVILFFILIKQGHSGWPLASVDAVARLSPALVWFFLAYRWKGTASAARPVSKDHTSA